MNARYCPCFALYGFFVICPPAPDRRILIAGLSDFVVVGRVRFAGDAREAHVPSFRRSEDPDWRATVAASPFLIGLERRLQTRGYLIPLLTRIALEEHANVFVESYWHETHGLIRSSS